MSLPGIRGSQAYIHVCQAEARTQQGNDAVTSLEGNNHDAMLTARILVADFSGGSLFLPLIADHKVVGKRQKAKWHHVGSIHPSVILLLISRV